MTFRPCPECKQGPRGIRGHEHIVVDQYPPPGESGSPSFVCTACGTHWRRTYTGSGTFAWGPEEDPFKPR